MRLTWNGGVFTPSLAATATLMAPAPAGARSSDPHEVICQDGAAQR